jgi:signal transduction histidine kinase
MLTRPSADENAPKTCFASPERNGATELTREIEAIGASEVVSALLRCTACAAVLVDARRQIVGVNDSYLRLAGLSEAGAALGLRPGEVVHCVHANTGQSGCGTAVPCASCGLALAVVLSQREGVFQTAECALSFGDPARPGQLSLSVEAHPLRVCEDSYTLVVLRDISADKRRAAMEASFQHDLKNVAMGLSGTAELLAMTPFDAETAELARDIQSLALRLTAELEIHTLMSSDRPSALPQRCKRIGLEAVISELHRLLAHHPAATQKRIQLPEVDPAVETPEVDPSLLQRVLVNLALNALEASQPGDTVRIGADTTRERILFSVWSRAAIPREVRPRIFQRYFSTKPGMARGQGTYTARLIGEKYLKGRVDFDTSEEEGTTFTFELPMR